MTSDAIYVMALLRISVIAENDERFARAHRQTGTTLAGRARVSGDLRNLFGAATRSHRWPDLVVAYSNCRFARANGGEPSCRKTFAQSHAWIHYQWNHNAGVDRLGDSARAHPACTPRIPIAIAALRRTTLVNKCDRLCALVLATGRRRTDPAPEAKEIRQHELPFSADANPA